jgi:hypothetical protein
VLRLRSDLTCEGSIDNAQLQSLYRSRNDIDDLDNVDDDVSMMIIIYNNEVLHSYTHSTLYIYIYPSIHQ